MPTITVSDLQPGMVLGSDAVHSNGRVLLRSGTRLEDRHIKMFKTWGLAGADIDGLSQADVESERLKKLDPRVVEAVREELAEQFRHADLSHPMVGELHRLLVRRRTEQLHREGDRDLDS